jgi:uncharacterized protein (TIGR02246 family)
MDGPVVNSLLAPRDIHAIRALHDEWIAAELRGDIAAVLELCTEDVRWLVPNGAPVEGKSAAASLLGSGTHRIEYIQVTDLRIDGSGTTAYKTGRFETRYSAPGTREPEIVCGTHLWVLRKDSSAWKVALVTWHVES